MLDVVRSHDAAHRRTDDRRHGVVDATNPHRHPGDLWAGEGLAASRNAGRFARALEGRSLKVELMLDLWPKAEEVTSYPLTCGTGLIFLGLHFFSPHRFPTRSSVPKAVTRANTWKALS